MRSFRSAAAAFWLMHGVCAAIPQSSLLAKAEFATIREPIVKIAAKRKKNQIIPSPAGTDTVS